MLNGHQFARPFAVIADLTAIDVELAAITISERRSCDGGNLAVKLDPSHPTQLFAQDLGLLADLKLVPGVLVMAASAPVEVRAWRLDAFVRPGEDLARHRPHHSPPVLHGFNSSRLSGQ